MLHIPREITHFWQAEVPLGLRVNKLGLPAVACQLPKVAYAGQLSHLDVAENRLDENPVPPLALAQVATQLLSMPEAANRLAVLPTKVRS